MTTRINPRLIFAFVPISYCRIDKENLSWYCYRRAGWWRGSGKTTENSDETAVVWLLLCRCRARVSAKNEMPAADNSPGKQQKQQKQQDRRICASYKMKPAYWR